MNGSAVQTARPEKRPGQQKNTLEKHRLFRYNEKNILKSTPMEELNMMNFAPQVIEQAKAAKSVEELLALAKENCFEMTPEEAATYFAQLNPVTGEIDDEELENVSGGATCKADDGRTYTTVTPLELEGRKRELARIIGGTNITETTLKSAEEMLRS